MQTTLFCGVPKIINALSTIRANSDDATWKSIHSIYQEGQKEGKLLYNIESPRESWSIKGEELMRQRFGDKAYEITAQKMSDLHPVFWEWIKSNAYGRVLSRPGLDMKLRSLCIVAALAGQNVKPQLYSHLKAGMRLGCTEQEMKCVLEQTYLIWGKEAQEQADSVWMEVERKKKKI